MSYETILYETDDRIARITLNRPDLLNAINETMPFELQDSVQQANEDDSVRVIILSGAGASFCAGYDLQRFAQNTEPESMEQPWDPMADFSVMMTYTRCFMSLWRSYKPVLCKVHGHAVAGGSDIALCCDIVIAADDARFGYMPARVWGCPTTAMWLYRLGMERAKRMLFTGDTIDGKEAARIGLISESAPKEELNQTVMNLASRMASVPINQLMMQKLVINQAMESMGMQSSQLIATVFDGISRHSPEGVEFLRVAREKGWKEAVKLRDDGDYDWTGRKPF
jgi:enoyl-CoA hydratase